jgi:hypothetical protein
MRLHPNLIANIVVFASAAAALACAPAPPRGYEVEIGEENAIIVWDAASRTEHFIRRATFATPANDFGFLVPTPTRPTLAEASDDAFRRLGEVTAPAIVTEVRYEPAGGALSCSANAPRDMITVVQVLEETHLAGYDAAVLAANDPSALNNWLGQHGYESRPALTEWLGDYTNAGWVITAFKIAKVDPKRPRVGTTAVRMSFQTDRPFFPYREPADQRGPSAEWRGQRLLRVYFIGDGRVAGQLGVENWWQGKTVWANALPETDRGRLEKTLSVPLPDRGSLWLTEFEDRSSPRPGTDDVFFGAADNQIPVERPPFTVHERRTSVSDTIVALCIPIVILTIVILVVRQVLSAINWLVGG